MQGLAVQLRSAGLIAVRLNQLCSVLNSAGAGVARGESVSFRTPAPAEKREVHLLMVEDLWDGVVSGKLALPIVKTFPLAKVADAFDHMRTNQHFGKIVVRP